MLKKWTINLKILLALAEIIFFRIRALVYYFSNNQSEDLYSTEQQELDNLIKDSYYQNN